MSFTNVSASKVNRSRHCRFWTSCLCPVRLIPAEVILPNATRLLLTLFKPHLVSAIRNSFAYQRLDSALETEGCGVISINSDGKTSFVSEFAGQLLDGYFADEKRQTNSLPEILWEWMKQTDSAIKLNKFGSPPETFKIENQTGELTVRYVYDSATRERTLLLERKKFFSLQEFEKLLLTGREAEILFLVTRGKTDSTIAELCGISPRTVHKHIEHIYCKLGVETRTGAMLRASEILRWQK